MNRLKSIQDATSSFSSLQLGRSLDERINLININPIIADTNLVCIVPLLCHLKDFQSVYSVSHFIRSQNFVPLFKSNSWVKPTKSSLLPGAKE